MNSDHRSAKRRRESTFQWYQEPYNKAHPEMAMWVAVITQAMMDALSRPTNSEAVYHKHEAICWLTSGSRDFNTVCFLAGFDPDYVRRRIKKTFSKPSPWRADAGKGKRYLERKLHRKALREKLEKILSESPSHITNRITA